MNLSFRCWQIFSWQPADRRQEVFRRRAQVHLEDGAHRVRRGSVSRRRQVRHHHRHAGNKRHRRSVQDFYYNVPKLIIK